VTLALTVDEDGFPKQSKILEGNISEPQTLEGMLNELAKADGTQKTIVIDAGIASEKNIEIIRQKGFKYVAVSRKRSYSDDFCDSSVEKDLKLLDGETKLKVKLVEKDGEAFLHCHSIEKELKEKAILDKKTDRFEQELKKLKDGLLKKGSQKKYEKIIEKVSRLKQRYGVGSLYDITIENADGKAKQIDYSKNSNGKAKEMKAGEYILRTNRIDLSEEEISKIHQPCEGDNKF
jgi:pentose-5-phosphate-3-epimerase